MTSGVSGFYKNVALFQNYSLDVANFSFADSQNNLHLCFNFDIPTFSN